MKGVLLLLSIARVQVLVERTRSTTQRHVAEASEETKVGNDAECGRISMNEGWHGVDTVRSSLG